MDVLDIAQRSQKAYEYKLASLLSVRASDEYDTYVVSIVRCLP
jgi:hypothetical protein